MKRTVETAEDARLRIIANKFTRSRLFPSLLHVCTYTRRKALQSYTPWGCYDPDTSMENDAQIYVKPDVVSLAVPCLLSMATKWFWRVFNVSLKDTFFFGENGLDAFWLLETLIDESAPDKAEADDIARCNLLPQVSYIKHFSFDWELWSEMLETEAFWLVNFDSANMVTIAIQNPNR